MTLQARREYVAEMRRRYAAAPREQRSLLLDEVIAMTGYHRKYAIALLRGPARSVRKRRRRRVYGPDVAAALIEVWKASDYPWSVRLKAALPLWLPYLVARRELDVSTQIALLRMSARTIDRLLQAKRGEIRRRLYGHTRRAHLLKHDVPIRSVRWDVAEPGWAELDTVSHCGANGGGEFINSVNLTDIASTWTETRAICGKGERATVAAIEEIRQSLPFILRGLDSDSGSEFVNYHCVRYCKGHEIDFTRSRPYKKNDNAHVEQKNWTHVRRIFGWNRLEGAATAEAMNQLYRNELRIWLNYFQPSVKLHTKTRIGSRVRKCYDTPQTPLDRLIAMGALSQTVSSELLAQRAAIDPFALADAIEQEITAILHGAQPGPVGRARGAPALGGLRSRPKDEHRAYRGDTFPGKVLTGSTRVR